MTDDLVKRLRVGIHTSVDPLALTNEAADRIEQLEAALRKLDDMIYELDAGDLDLYEVGDFIDAALGEKKDGD
jgi:hypothetical protein